MLGYRMCTKSMFVANPSSLEITFRHNSTSKHGAALLQAIVWASNCGEALETTPMPWSRFIGTSPRATQAKHQISGPTSVGTLKLTGPKFQPSPTQTCSLVETHGALDCCCTPTQAVHRKGSTSMISSNLESVRCKITPSMSIVIILQMDILLHQMTC